MQIIYISHTPQTVQKFSNFLPLQGLGDETHTVVKQALVSIEIVLPALMLTHRFTGQQQQYSHQPHRKQTKMPSITTVVSPLLNVGGVDSAANNKPDNANILLASNDNYGNVTIENIIDELMLVFGNKYWVVQCKYCDLISKLDFERLQLIYGVDRAQLYEVMCPWLGCVCIF